MVCTSQNISMGLFFICLKWVKCLVSGPKNDTQKYIGIWDLFSVSACTFCWISETVPKKETFFGTFFLASFRSLHFEFEVTTYWQWLTLLYWQTYVIGKNSLILNLNEMSVARAPNRRRDLVVYQKSPIHALHARNRRRPVRRVKAPQRGAMTHVALVADAAESQSLLPQVFLVNQHMVSVGACQSEPNSSIYIWREPTAWSSSSMMIRIIDILYDHLPHVLEGYQPILILDCATPHLPLSVIEAATRFGFWVVYAPARTTWLVHH